MRGMRAMFTRFRPKHPTTAEEVRALVAERKGFYTKMPGLRWKAWVRDPKTGDYGAFYLWENHAAMQHFLHSNVWRSVPKVHGLVPSVEVFEVMDVLDRKG